MNERRFKNGRITERETFKNIVNRDQQKNDITQEGVRERLKKTRANEKNINNRIGDDV